MAEDYSPEVSESTPECPVSNSPADELELFAEDVAENDEHGSEAETPRKAAGPDLSWEKQHLPFPVSQPLSPAARKLWEYYGATYHFGYAPICHQMLEQWEVQFGPLIDAAATLSRNMEVTSDEDSQLLSIFHSMRRLLDDFGAIWELTRFNAADDPFIRQEMEKAGFLKPAVGGMS